MSLVIDYYVTLISPWSYLGGQRLMAMARRHGATIDVKPIDLGKVFPVSGGLPLAKRAPQRQAYRLVELARWRDHLNLPLNIHPKYFPTPIDLASRVVVAARPGGTAALGVTTGAPQLRDALGAPTGSDALDLTQAILQAVWVDEKNIADAETLKGLCAACGLDGGALLAAADTAAVRTATDALTEEAIARGVFGAPTYVFGGELFWGQDRLEFLDRALAKAASSALARHG
jgi:2-hydroxychromene-2-carboxylate isomerase